MSMTKVLANLYRSTVNTAPEPRDQESNHMPPLDDETTYTADSKIDSKSAGGLASVFKSLTSGRSAKTPPALNVFKSAIPAATIQLAEQLQSTSSVSESIHGGPEDYDGLVEQLRANKKTSERVVIADELCKAISEYPLTGISKIWHAAKDLIGPTEPTELRHAGYRLLTACVQKDASDLERREYFYTLTESLNLTDFSLQINAIAELARHGKSLAGFHYDAMPLLTKWLKIAFDVHDRTRKSTKAASGRPSTSRLPTHEEKDLQQVFELITNVIKFSFNVSSDEETALLIEEVLCIAMQAHNPAELESCIRIVDAVITFATIPVSKLRDCIGVLCTIHSLVRDVRKEAWNTFGNLCRSHNGHSTIAILLDIVQHSQRSSTREVKGALAVLGKIHAKNGRKQYPLIPHDLLFTVLAAVVADQPGKFEHDILRFLLAFYTEESDEGGDTIFEHDWSIVLDIAATCATRIVVNADTQSTEGALRSLSPTSSFSTLEAHDVGVPRSEAASLTILKLVVRLEDLMTNASQIHNLQKFACVVFFARIHEHLPEPCAKLVIEAYDEGKLCYPSDSDWRDNVRFILKAFFSNRRRSSTIRLLALKVITDVYEVVDMIITNEQPKFAYEFVSDILSNLVDETDTQILAEVVDFAVAVAENADIEIFKYILEQLQHTISHGRLISPITSPRMVSHRPGLTSIQSGKALSSTTSSAANLVARGIVQIFMRAMDLDAEKAVQTYEEILKIAKSNDIEIDARISAMKLLFRVRADWADRVFITPFTESEGLAASLYRTASSLARKHADDEAAAAYTSTRASKGERPEESAGLASSLSKGLRSLSSSNLTTLASISKSSGSVKAIGPNRTMVPVKQMWMTPDVNALPSHVSGRASVLFASWDIERETVVGTEAPNLPVDRRVLRIYAWLEIVNNLLQEGCHWEIYSYILVHLSAQLGNPGVFKAATIQVRDLRRIICEQISRGTIHEPPPASGLRRADVAICVFQTLTMLISYHEHFHRPEEDDIVKSFVAGLTGWEKSAKCCIHALSICCHELPSSMRSSLFPTLQKMSQIITQSSIAVHVLEYLACLSRLPELYSNFREDEYKFVFGICFRFLQSVRERNSDAKQSIRPNGTQIRHNNTPADVQPSILETESGESNFQPNTSDDLPQYVYALAYHVIIFWFLALRLSDRGNQVSWLIKNLVVNDELGKQQIDEQAEIVIDFMQRTAYANVDESRANIDFVPEKYGEILKRRWLVGKSIITIEQAKDNDWAQITKRQPSATSHYMVHERFERPPAHQMLSLAGDSRHAEMNMVLPNYLLLQLGSTFTMSEESRPIPLPDDDSVRRAIGTFDRIPTVDGHKVGVIYIGENQTSETEILANVMGSGDYTTFLEGLGTLTKLEGATFNTQGLDRQYNTDGKYTFCWRDRVTEIVFHVPTLMPTNLELDKQCISKKRHIGNDFVNIIFNNSGTPFKFDTFPSEFNFVNIVITPESRASFVARRARSKVAKEKAFYRVQVMSKPGFPEISPAAETKLVSLRALPDFIRLLALNASVFSLVWANRQGGDHVSSWRSRLRAINALRAKYGGKIGLTSNTGATLSSPANATTGHIARPDSLTNSRRSSVVTSLSGMTATSDNALSAHNGTQKENMLDAIDFSKWA